MKKSYLPLTLLASLTACTGSSSPPSATLNIKVNPSSGVVTLEPSSAQVPVFASPSPAPSISYDYTALVSQSSCATYSWKDRGVATAGYVEGVARSFHRSFCRLNGPGSAANAATQLASQAIGPGTTDALSWYDRHISPPPTTPVDRLKDLYVLELGLGMRESSGTYCTGRDTSASNFSASTCEAGAFQTSYNSVSSAPAELQALWAWYQNNPSACDFSVWSRAIDPKSKSNWNCQTAVGGTGTGATWQSFVRSCPGFGAEWAAVILRKDRGHYGPILRKEAEWNSDCRKLLDQVSLVPCT